MTENIKINVNGNQIESAPNKLLIDICDNISPGLAWPPKMTTICPLGPSAVSPITSLLNNFSDEITNMLPTKIPITQ